jgi:hypothetical protein
MWPAHVGSGQRLTLREGPVLAAAKRRHFC